MQRAWKRARRLPTSPLWPQGPPEELKTLWAGLAATLRAANEDWEVWIDWYEARLQGKRSNQRLEIDRALIPNEIWEEGPAKVNAEIKALIQKHQPIRKTKPPEIPKTLPAALEPVWSKGKLVLPKASTRTDGDKRATTAALKALRADLIELADDAEAETGNFDKRPAAYLRRIAEHIPNRAPRQHELFRLAHAKEVLEDLSSQINEQWPTLLAIRFSKLTLQFDRTVRQSDGWKVFIKNAQTNPLTAEQEKALPAIDIAVIEALRDDDAKQFVASEIPEALEALQKLPETLGASSAAHTSVHEDILESTNNILKEAAEAALEEDIKDKKEPKRVSTLGKFVKGVGDVAKETATNYFDEAGKSFVGEGERLGKGTGPAITRWVKRLAKGGLGVAGASSLAQALIASFPEKFGWLEPVLRHLHLLH
jgi:hypothetical protein